MLSFSLLVQWAMVMGRGRIRGKMTTEQWFLYIASDCWIHLFWWISSVMKGIQVLAFSWGHFCEVLMYRPPQTRGTSYSLTRARVFWWHIFNACFGDNVLMILLVISLGIEYIKTIYIFLFFFLCCQHGLQENLLNSNVLNSGYAGLSLC